jgi:hypothetical protein
MSLVLLPGPDLGVCLFRRSVGAGVARDRHRDRGRAGGVAGGRAVRHRGLSAPRESLFGVLSHRRVLKLYKQHHTLCRLWEAAIDALGDLATSGHPCPAFLVDHLVGDAQKQWKLLVASGAWN